MGRQKTNANDTNANDKKGNLESSLESSNVPERPVEGDSLTSRAGDASSDGGSTPEKITDNASLKRPPAEADDNNSISSSGAVFKDVFSSDASDSKESSKNTSEKNDVPVSEQTFDLNKIFDDFATKVGPKVAEIVKDKMTVVRKLAEAEKALKKAREEAKKAEEAVEAAAKEPVAVEAGKAEEPVAVEIVVETPQQVLEKAQADVATKQQKLKDAEANVEIYLKTSLELLEKASGITDTNSVEFKTVIQNVADHLTVDGTWEVFSNLSFLNALKYLFNAIAAWFSKKPEATSSETEVTTAAPEKAETAADAVSRYEGMAKYNVASKVVSEFGFFKVAAEQEAANAVPTAPVVSASV